MFLDAATVATQPDTDLDNRNNAKLSTTQHDADRQPTSHRMGILSVVYLPADRQGSPSPDADASRARIVTGSEDGVIKIWDVDSGQLLHSLEAHISAVTSLAVSPDSRRLVSGSRDSTAKIWDPRTGKEILTLRGHQQEVTSVAFSSDGLCILTGSRDGLAILWESLRE